MRTSSVAFMLSAAFIGGAALAATPAAAPAARSPMTFFITSVGSGKGADFGGLEGADRHCQTLAKAAGAGHRTWRAYLSTTTAGGKAGVDARDRIGKGPWHNITGDLIARNVAELHEGPNNINPLKALTEKGTQVNWRGMRPNTHDILTGSSPEGRAMPGTEDTTCRNWTSSDEGKTIVGHHDRLGISPGPDGRSWNSSHPTRGCSQPALISSGGAGLLYCFAAR